MDCGFVVGGFTFSFGNGKRDFWLTKLDGSGNELWSCTQGGTAYEEAYAVLETAEDEFVMAGWKNYAEGGPYDFYVVKISPASSAGLFFDYGVFVYVFAAIAVLCVGYFCSSATGQTSSAKSRDAMAWRHKELRFLCSMRVFSQSLFAADSFRNSICSVVMKAL
jgi:hypothetical protein